MNFNFDNVVIREIEKEHEHEFVFNNLPNNMSYTFGNFCRRILLDYSSGIALVGLKILSEGKLIKTEFSRLEGLDQTTIGLIANLKKINIVENYDITNNHDNLEEIFSLNLNINNETNEEIEITADLLEKKNNIIIKNPQLKIAKISPKKTIFIETYWKKGVGYHDAEQQKKEYFSDDKENEIIVLDTSYSPFKFSEISYNVKKEIIGMKEEIEILYLSFKKADLVEPKILLKKALNNCISFFNYIDNNITLNEKEEQ